MKIVSGTFGGRRLNTPKNNDIRPTSDKIRGAIFNMLQSRGCIDGATVLDGFCGTGALGLEALSRGATHCTFMDKAKSSLDLARENSDMLGATNMSNFVLKDCTKITNAIINTKPYNLVFLDPPYNKELISAALLALTGENLLSDGAWIVCESEKAFTCPNIKNMIGDNEKTYGDTKITLINYQPK